MTTKKTREAKRAVRTARSEAVSADSCFTIMPFGGWFDTYYESIYVPAIQAADLVARRADDLYRPSTIVHDIWEYTKSAKLVLADLSGKNANVFYELGLAHALAKPAVLVTESMDDVPFDLRGLRIIQYDKNESKWGDLLQHKITTAIKEVIASPLDAVLPAFLKVNPESKTKGVSETERQILELKRDVDLLRREVATRESAADRLRDYYSQKSGVMLSSPSESSGMPPMTPREKQVAEQVSLGRSNAEIAESLGLSSRTIQVMVAQLLEKFDVPTRAQLALRVISHR